MVCAAVFCLVVCVTDMAPAFGSQQQTANKIPGTYPKHLQHHSRESRNLESAARPQGRNQIMCVLGTSQRREQHAKTDYLMRAFAIILCKPEFIVMGRWCTHESRVTVQKLWLQPSCAQTAQIGQQHLHMRLFPAEQEDAFVWKTVAASCTVSAAGPEMVRTRPTI